MDQPRILVVGAGIAGASTAFALGRRGAAVVVVDGSFEGAATAAGAGIIQPWSAATGDDIYQLSRRGAEHYATLLDQLADVGVSDVSFRRSGALVVNADAAILGDAESRVQSRAGTSPLVGDVVRVDSDAARTLFPPLAEDLDGFFVPGGARVDGRLLCRGLLDGVKQLGGSLIEGTATLVRSSGKAAVEIDRQRFDADAIVLASGAWTNDALAPLGHRVAMAPQRGQITHLLLPGIDTSDWPSLSPLADHYMVAFDDSRVVVGATRETGSGFDPRVTAAGQRHVLANALALAPGLADATLIETRVGLRPMADDGLPIVGELEGGLYLATGYGPIGLTIAPYTGSQIAELILDGGSTFDLTPFAPR